MHSMPISSIGACQDVYKRQECTVCENGERILETFERSAPGDYDMILMDVQMPVMNGYEATRAIRRALNSDKWKVIRHKRIEKDS